MPITDIAKRSLAQQHRLYHKICRRCGVKNAPAATKCRKCHGENLRWQKRQLGAK